MLRILWTQKQDEGPAPRQSAAMVYDSGRGRTVLFGGLSAAVADLGDTWEWDGANWTLMADSGPPPRSGSVMAYDAQRSQTVLFSGSNAAPDTWGWDGNNWTQLADSGPPKRSFSAMVYDGKRQRSVLFGGSGGPNIRLSDTWQWDGAAWTQVSETTPPARDGHSMAYDSSEIVRCCSEALPRPRRLETHGSGMAPPGRKPAASAPSRVTRRRWRSKGIALRSSAARALHLLPPASPGPGTDSIGRCGKISHHRHGLGMPCATTSREPAWWCSEGGTPARSGTPGSTPRGSGCCAGPVPPR